MAAPKMTMPLELDETPAPVLVVTPPPDTVVPSAPVWTLERAFHALRLALALHYQDDNIPAYLQCEELGIIYTNGGSVATHPNCVIAWRQLIGLLEQAMGAPLRTL